MDIVQMMRDYVPDGGDVTTDRDFAADTYFSRYAYENMSTETLKAWWDFSSRLYPDAEMGEFQERLAVDHLKEIMGLIVVAHVITDTMNKTCIHLTADMAHNCPTCNPGGRGSI